MNYFTGSEISNMNELPTDKKDDALRCSYCMEEIINAETITDKMGMAVCSNCEAKSVKDVIYDCCLASDSAAPIEMAIHLMKFPGFKMHCPEHHFLVPAVLLSAYSNRVKRKDKLEKWLIAASQRSEKVPGAFCGTHGSCGAAVGTGMFISIITGATPYKTEEWKLANSMTGRSLLKMAAYGGPRCCKRVSFVVIQEACSFLKESFNISLSVPEKIECTFHSDNQECLKNNCLFYPLS